MSEIVTKAEFQTYISTAIVDNTRDDLIRQYVNQFIDTFCARTLAGATFTSEKHSVMESGRYELIVKNPPIRTLTSVKSGRTTPETVASDSYVVEDADAGLIRFISQLTVGVHQYEVTYDGGFSPIPDDLKLCALSIMARERQKVTMNRHGIRGRAFANGNVDFEQLDLEPFELRILNRYRVVRFD